VSDEFFELHAQAQYDDLVGTAAADGHDGPPLHPLAVELGVDTERYFPIGIRVWNGRNDAGHVGLSVQFMLVEIGPDGLSKQELKDFAKQNGGKLDVTLFDCGYVRPEQVLPYLKRLEIVALRRDATGIPLANSGKRIEREQ
jgi:hypothetical protein